MKAFANSILVLFVIVYWTSPSQAGEKLEATVATVGKAVVFLRYQEQAHEKRDGKLVEIWHRFPDSKDFVQKLNWKGGTGFVTQNEGWYYLVTAKHVAQSLPPQTEIILNKTSGSITTISFQTLQHAILGAKWFFHTSADVAVHPFGIEKDMEVGVLDESVYLPDKIELDLLSPAYVLGFPMGQGVTDVLSPFAKQSQIASWMTTIKDPNIRPDLKFILLDQALAQGYSGSPVFAELPTGPLVIGRRYKPPVRLIGILSGAMYDQTGGKLSLIVPLSYLCEVFLSEDFKKYQATLRKRKNE